jgi:hypothetical protein
MRLAFRGSMKPPWAVVKTSPVSRQLEPAANRSWSCRLRWARRMVTSGVRSRQHRDRRLGLHRVQPQLAVDPMQCLPDRRSAPVEIDVGPCEAERLNAAQSHRERDCPECVQPVLFGSIEKAKRLSASEASNLAIVGHPQLNQPRHISTEQFLLDGILQCSPQHSHDVTNRARRQSA